MSDPLPGEYPEVREGQFHRVLMGADQVVHLARTEAAAARLPRRAAVLRTLAALGLGFRTPEVLGEYGGRGDGAPPYLLVRRIPGAPLPRAALAAPAFAEAVAAGLAELLAELEAAGATDHARRTLTEEEPGRWPSFASDVRAELFPLMTAAGRERAGRELAALDGLPHITRAVVHGDLGPENVLWETADGPPRLSGVIDWDDVRLGDPAEDLAAIAAGYGDRLLGRVLALGGGSSGTLPRRIAVIRGTFALQQALQAHRDGDEEELADGLAGYVSSASSER
ncbi:aminoglycoside phosphotransferase family protein [Spongiactinospora sp. TRM90649]|uniref:aminoglycoside phosphotransferase family protein n=1 Tax=Spongiactinospora sp. TRM90649 TaxID=3031114 RepID=UPI0023F7F0D8|nr:aminoglycoside phosphotransferase family protein [Spongiactinospora sp. TRM90649]MDF5756992.1 aminoglycoside phosphotransferase family protein [Spongiactinospora sp. TRM90649]